MLADLLSKYFFNVKMYSMEKPLKCNDNITVEGVLNTNVMEVVDDKVRDSFKFCFNKIIFRRYFMGCTNVHSSILCAN